MTVTAPGRGSRLRRPDGVRPVLPLPRWIGVLAVGSVIGMLPWIVYLGFTLPARVRAQHYDLAWVGFDCFMCTVLACLALAAFRRHPATGLLAAVASMMLVVDAWFDVFTSSNKPGEQGFAVFLAFAGELPLAVVCAWIAVHAERARARAYRNLHERWEAAVRAGGDTVAAIAHDVGTVSGRAAPQPR